MTTDSRLIDRGRLTALGRTRLVGSPPAECFDRLTRLAAQLLRVPTATLSLVDDQREFFLSQYGLREPWNLHRELPLAASYAREIVRTEEPLLLTDTAAFATPARPEAAEGMRIGAYAGIPLQTAAGYTLGAFSVWDPRPRVWLPGEVGLLSELAAIAMTEINLHGKTLHFQENLAHSDRLRERMSVPCLTTGADLLIVDWNSAAARFLGYSWEEALGQLVPNLLFPAERRAELTRQLLSIVQRSEPTWANVPCVCRDLQLVQTQWTLVPWHHPSGEPGIAILIDNGERTGLVAGDATDEGENGGRLRRQKLETLGTLAGGVAHEFNNFLGIILGNTDRARHQVKRGQNPLEALDQIFSASRRARGLVQQVLGFADPSTERRMPQSLRPILEESVSLLRATLPPNVELSFIGKTDGPIVQVDSTQVTQAIINLVRNAWHALEGKPGRITVNLETISAAEALVESTPEKKQAQQYARISVQDTGHGMDFATLQRVFEPFFSTKARGEGTGLGLSIVRGIMEEHEGFVRIQSAPDEGTIFSLYFPGTVAPTLPIPKEEDSAQPTVRGRGEHIWFLDDDEPMVQLITHALDRAGYQVAGFTDPTAALAAFAGEPNRFAVAVTDVHLPSASGLEVATQLRTIRPELPIILSTGCVTDLLREEISRANIQGVILKPNAIDELGLAIHALLNSEGMEA